MLTDTESHVNVDSI